MKLSDYITKFIEQQGVKHVFGITGGAIAHVFDSISKNPNVNYVCNQHEQASAMAADAYSRVSANLGVAIATSGPGATNLVTGICCSYYDSIPSLFITGQVSTFRSSEKTKTRQLGFQETDIVNMVKPITKYAVLLKNPNEIRFELEKAVYIAKSGRPGPVLIDVPDNLQREDINPDKIPYFVPEKIEHDKSRLGRQVGKTIDLISSAKRPVLVLGTGIRSSNSIESARELADKLKFPVLLTWGAMDFFPHDYPLLVGGFGLMGTRYGNFTVQNSDLVLSIGSRLDTHATGSTVTDFARDAKKIVVDIDESELNKFNKWGLKIDLPIQADAGDFLEILNRKNIKTYNFSAWFEEINFWKEKYPMCLPEYYKQKKNVNSYVFLKKLSKQLKEGDIIIADTGESLPQSMNTLELKTGQRLFSAFNNTPMGYALPASIGASFASPLEKIVCITGDGGFQVNIQELATIAKHKLPIKIFIFNNQGYNMIKTTQDQWLNSDYQASSVEKGLVFPDFVKISRAYEIPSVSIKNNKQIEKKLGEILNSDGPFLCNLETDSKPNFLTTKFGKPLEDLSPLLSREEFESNMIKKK